MFHILKTIELYRKIRFNNSIVFNKSARILDVNNNHRRRQVLVIRRDRHNNYRFYVYCLMLQTQQ